MHAFETCVCPLEHCALGQVVGAAFLLLWTVLASCGCIFVIFGRFGHCQAAAYNLTPPMMRTKRVCHSSKSRPRGHKSRAWPEALVERQGLRGASSVDTVQDHILCPPPCPGAFRSTAPRCSTRPVIGQCPGAQTAGARGHHGPVRIGGGAHVQCALRNGSPNDRQLVCPMWQSGPEATRSAC